MTPSSQPLCQWIVDAGDPFPILEAGDLEIGLIALIDQAAFESVIPELREGLEILPPLERLRFGVKALRERASFVLLVFDGSLQSLFALLEPLSEEERPDLVVVSDRQNRLLFGRPTEISPAIVSPPLDDAVEIIVRRDPDLRFASWSMLAQPLGQRGITVGEPILKFLDRIGPSYCETWGKELPGGRLSRRIDVQGMLELSASLLREAFQADVAILNRSLIDQSFRPSRERALTASDFYAAIEHDEVVYEATVPREWLQLVAEQREALGIVTPGLTGTGSSLRVRGRQAIARVGYHVVTTRFLASRLPRLPEGSRWSPVRAERMPGLQGKPKSDLVNVREVVLALLSKPSTVDPRDGRPSPNEAPEWLVQGFVDGNFSGSNISNRAGYRAAQLNRSSTVAMGVEVNIRLDVSAPQWTWENLGIFRYRTQWTERRSTMEMRTPGSFDEAVDQVQLRSTASYRGLRPDPNAPSSLLPDPYLELFAETELTQPSTRSYHFFLFRPTIGARFPFTPELELKLQLGIESQLLDPSQEVEAGGGVMLSLRPWDWLRAGERFVKLQGLFDFFFADPGDTNRWQLRGSIDLSLDLAGPLAITSGFRIYAEQRQGMDVGIATDDTIGLR
ncbi:MAG: hypothetical protein N2515_07495, partial [Deltaproteobacteria bacterium]|nr:hypothetical protein [Deltaproteobacteria bacterium]